PGASDEEVKARLPVADPTPPRPICVSVSNKNTLWFSTTSGRQSNLTVTTPAPSRAAAGLLTIGATASSAPFENLSGAPADSATAATAQRPAGNTVGSLGNVNRPSSAETPFATGATESGPASRG